MLNSWKEIAQYFDRGVRTVQRWERDLNLPVHRIGTGKRSPVYANLRELEFWLHSSGQVEHRFAKDGASPSGRPPVKASQLKPIENSRRLLDTARSLTHNIAQASLRQRRQAEELQAKILQMRAKLK